MAVVNATRKFYRKRRLVPRNINRLSLARPSRFNKRWYVDTAIPRSVPLIGGSYFRAGSGLQKRSLSGVVTALARKNEIDKFKVVNVGIANLLQNTWYTFNPLGNIPIGTGEDNRIGTDIFVKEVMFRMWCSSPNAPAGIADQPVAVRVAWIRTSVPVLSSNDTLSPGGLGNANLLIAGLTDGMTGHFDHDKVTVMYDKTTIVPGSAIAGKEGIALLDLTIPCNFPYKYAGSISNYSTTNKNMYLVVWANTVGGTTGTDYAVVGGFSSVVKFIDHR